MLRSLLSGVLTMCLSAVCCMIPSLASAAPVEWSAEILSESPESGTVVLRAKVEPGYHFYSFAPEGGVNALEIKVEDRQGLEILSKPVASSDPVVEYQPLMGATLGYWGKDVDFVIPFELKGIEGCDIDVEVRFQYCNDTQCFTPRKERFELSFGTVDVAKTSADASADRRPGVAQLNRWWDPVSTTAPTTDSSPWKILLLGFIGGLAALLTPCVWPMIPMTLSFFLKKGKSSKKSRGDALTYGLSIIVIYLVLGIAVTLIFGAGKLNELSTNAVFNLVFFLLLVVFAVSFFGAFDIKLPSKWSNAIDSKAESTTGLISIFFMAFTLALVSFSCTGPIIGTLLVEAASDGNILGPALGMGGFALGLALPFSIFAMFPSMLQEMPKTGGWLNSVKVVLGFVELILSLKFLSVADMAYGWRILDREVFLSLWIVLFALLGLYLLGKLRFSHDAPSGHVGIVRFFMATVSFAFAVYLLPGLWGAPLKAVSSFVPPLETQDFNLYTHDREYVEFHDYDEGMKYAADNNMPVLMDFSGYGCVNCRNMEAEVFDTDEVRDIVTENFVLIKLMVDDKKDLPVPFTVDDNGKVLTLESVGEKWSYLQSHKFGANSQPYYIVLDNAGRPMNDPVYYDNDVARFVGWLELGLQKYQAE